MALAVKAIETCDHCHKTTQEIDDYATISDPTQAYDQRVLILDWAGWVWGFGRWYCPDCFEAQIQVRRERLQEQHNQKMAQVRSRYAA